MAMNGDTWAAVGTSRNPRIDLTFCLDQNPLGGLVKLHLVGYHPQNSGAGPRICVGIWLDPRHQCGMVHKSHASSWPQCPHG